MVTRLLRSRRAAPSDTRPPDIARPLRESAAGMISREGNAAARVLGRRNGTYHRNVTRNSPPCSWKEHLGTSAPYFQPDGAPISLQRRRMKTSDRLLFGMRTTSFRRSEEHTSELQSLMRISYA